MFERTEQMQKLEFKNIPKAKHRAKVLRTLVGAVIFLGAWALPLLGFPWQVAVGVAFFGGFVASKETVLGYAKVLPVAIGDLVRALGGNGKGNA